mmetsp:Transcript_29706/g.78850  ORF Transcript_29706/g.78850 Transcript_29706/m.78850 type:complete len:329 (-) Transcript_29706:495-1481(-)
MLQLHGHGRRLSPWEREDGRHEVAQSVQLFVHRQHPQCCQGGSQDFRVTSDVLLEHLEEFLLSGCRTQGEVAGTDPRDSGRIRRQGPKCHIRVQGFIAFLLSHGEGPDEEAQDGPQDEVEEHAQYCHNDSLRGHVQGSANQQRRIRHDFLESVRFFQNSRFVHILHDDVFPTTLRPPVVRASYILVSLQLLDISHAVHGQRENVGCCVFQTQTDGLIQLVHPCLHAEQIIVDLVLQCCACEIVELPRFVLHNVDLDQGFLLQVVQLCPCLLLAAHLVFQSGKSILDLKSKVREPRRFPRSRTATAESTWLLGRRCVWKLVRAHTASAG